MAGEYDLISNFNSMAGMGNRDQFGGLNIPSALTGPSDDLMVTGGFGSPIVANPNMGALDISGFTPETIKSMPGLSGAGGAVDPSRGLGLNIPTLQMGFGALNSIGNLYAAFQSNALAKKQFRFQKDAYNQNVTNSIQSYNTALSDRARSRAVVEGQTDAERDSYVSNNSLKKI